MKHYRVTAEMTVFGESELSAERDVQEALEGEATILIPIVTKIVHLKAEDEDEQEQ